MKNTQDDTATEGCAPAAVSDADYLRAHGWKESGGDWLDPKFRRFTNFQQAVQDQQRRDACTHQTTFHLNGQTICNDCGNVVNQNAQFWTPCPTPSKKIHKTIFDLSKAVMTKEQEQHIQKTGCCPRPECQPHEGRATPMKWLGSLGRTHSLHCSRCDSVWLVPPPMNEPNDQSLATAGAGLPKP